MAGVGSSLCKLQHYHKAAKSKPDQYLSLDACAHKKQATVQLAPHQAVSHSMVDDSVTSVDAWVSPAATLSRPAIALDPYGHFSSEGRCQLPLLLMMLLIHANIGNTKAERSC